METVEYKISRIDVDYEKNMLMLAPCDHYRAICSGVLPDAESLYLVYASDTKKPLTQLRRAITTTFMIISSGLKILEKISGGITRGSISVALQKIREMYLVEGTTDQKKRITAVIYYTVFYSRSVLGVNLYETIVTVGGENPEQYITIYSTEPLLEHEIPKILQNATSCFRGTRQEACKLAEAHEEK